jgi:hypothetical protein
MRAAPSNGSDVKVFAVTDDPHRHRFSQRAVAPDTKERSTTITLPISRASVYRKSEQIQQFANENAPDNPPPQR